MFQLDFTPDPQGVLSVAPGERYGVCIQSILTAKRPVPFESWKDVAGLMAKLKSIGRPAHGPNGEAITYELLGEAPKLDLTPGEKNQLLLFMQDAPWAPRNLDVVMMVYQWVYSLQETEEIPEKKIALEA